MKGETVAYRYNLKIVAKIGALKNGGGVCGRYNATVQRLIKISPNIDGFSGKMAKFSG